MTESGHRSRRPNLFIAGAAKAGTTTIWSCLKSHPAVFMPTDELLKEPAYFSRDGERMGLEAYLHLFDGAGPSHQWVGEASTAYLTDPSSAARIHTFQPDARIIVVLRNPVDRAYSLFNWMVQEGYETAAKFQSALRLEGRRKSKTIPSFWLPGYYWNYMYFASGLYSAQIERYLTLFGEKVLILKFEDMVKDFDVFYGRVCRFLKITSVLPSTKPTNPSTRPANRYLQFAVRKCTDHSARFHRPSTKRARDGLIYRLQTGGRPERLDDTVRQDLLQKYRSDILRVAELVPFDVSDWLTGDATAARCTGES